MYPPEPFQSEAKAKDFDQLSMVQLETHFFINARDDMAFEGIKEMMVREFKSDAGQLQLQGMPETLRLAKDMSEQGISNSSEFFTYDIDLLDQMGSPCQPQFRAEAKSPTILARQSYTSLGQWFLSAT